MNPSLVTLLEQRLAALQAKIPEASSADLRKLNAAIRNARLSLARTRGSHTTSQWEALVAETRGECVRCGFDHAAIGLKPCKGYLIPLSIGGSNAIENLMPLCRSCAAAKGGEQIDWLSAWRERQTPKNPT